MINSTNSAKQSLFFIGSGLIGSRLTALLKDSYTIETARISTGFDITNPDTLSPLRESSSQIVIHLAAKTDVDGCESDKDRGEDGDAWKMNVTGAENVANVCKETGKKMIYFSTDFVFDGTKEPPYEYAEEDTPNPLSWYAKTKYEGEKAVSDNGVSHIIFRTAYPYRSDFPDKTDFVRAIQSRLDEGQPVKAVTDHIMSPTFIDDIAFALDSLIKNRSAGIYHVVGSEYISPFDAAQAIAREFELDASVISQTSRDEFFKGRATRPFNLALKNDKIQGLGIQMKTFQEGLKEIRKQIES